MILADKPKRWTSADVVAYLKKKNGWRKAGHAGTLDPMATGLLVILVDGETKKFDEFRKMEKEYEAEITLGYETETGDAEGEIVNNLSPITNHQINHNLSITKELIKQKLEGMEGEGWQTPPSYSAVKVGGVPAYKLARRGLKPDLRAKKINIYQANLIKYDPVSVRVSVRFVVSSGTYIRVLATELGRLLGTGATLTALRRTRIGEYKVEEAERIDKS